MPGFFSRLHKTSGSLACLIVRCPVFITTALPRRNRHHFLAPLDVPKQSHRVHGVPVHQHIRVEKRLLKSWGRERGVPYLPRRVVEEEVKVRLKNNETKEGVE